MSAQPQPFQQQMPISMPEQFPITLPQPFQQRMPIALPQRYREQMPISMLQQFQERMPKTMPQQILQQKITNQLHDDCASVKYNIEPRLGVHILNPVSFMMPSTPPFSRAMYSSDVIAPTFNNFEPIIIPQAVLTPPAPDDERTSYGPKTDGCRTIYVRNLPKKITEKILIDTFSICGPISEVQMILNKCCRIRFEHIWSVDRAVLLSDFHIRIGGSDHPDYNSKLHVQYAHSLDEDNEYKLLERIRLHKRHQRLEIPKLRPPSPPSPPILRRSEAETLTSRLGKEDTMKEALRVLITWLDKGECKRKNAAKFYSWIQSAYSHVGRLRQEKREFENIVENAKENLVNKNRTIGFQLAEIEKVFKSAKTQKVWDHFSKNQRKNMEEWKNDTHDFKESNSLDLMDSRKEEEMDLSDTEDTNDNKDMLQEDDGEELSILREKVHTLTEELVATRQSLQDCKANCADQQNENVRLSLELEESKKLVKSGNDSPVSFDGQLSVGVCAAQYSTSPVDDSKNEIRLISLIPIFLALHPSGASIDYICSYLIRFIPPMNTRDVENLLRKFPNLFKEVCTGIGASLEKKWTYIGFYDSGGACN